ncbi:MAG: efflux RND transporter periplasmic adaptor subunit [Desulfofustis sp.]|nr:efflux RND transporter periplasmic adaptor subunit [Desulfofustis sp.]
MTNRESSKRGLALTIIVCVMIALAVGGFVWWINKSEPVAQRETATKRAPMLVETVTVTKGDYKPQISVLGRVVASKEVVLRPRVEGEVIEISENFEPGAMVRTGELLAKLDPADFENSLTTRLSELQQAEADLVLEEAQGQARRRGYKMIDKELGSEQLALVFRQPQLQTIQARVQAAEAAVAQARLELERTSITAPFDALVLERMVALGSQAQPGVAMAHLVGVNEYWVIATVPLKQLQRLRFAEDGAEPSAATIRKRGVWGDDQFREGVVQRFIGALDEQTRLARVLITVEDPLGRQSGAPPLVLDSIVQTVIEGELLQDVVRLDRDYLRPGDTVWVIKDDKLSIREARVIFRDAEYAYISGGLEDGDEVVLTNLSRVREGAQLRRQGASE